jgi:hypothetical protein
MDLLRCYEQDSLSLEEPVCRVTSAEDEKRESRWYDKRYRVLGDPKALVSLVVFDKTQLEPDPNWSSKDVAATARVMRTRIV